MNNKARGNIRGVVGLGGVGAGNSAGLFGFGTSRRLLYPFRHVYDTRRSSASYDGRDESNWSRCWFYDNSGGGETCFMLSTMSVRAESVLQPTGKYTKEIIYLTRWISI